MTGKSRALPFGSAPSSPQRIRAESALLQTPHRSACRSPAPSSHSLVNKTLRYLPVPACCLQSPTGQTGPIGLFLQFYGIPHRRCPPVGLGIAATAGTDHLVATAPVGRLNNGGTEHGPLGLNVPRLPRYMIKALPEVGVEALSDRRLPDIPSRPSQYVWVCQV